MVDVSREVPGDRVFMSLTVDPSTSTGRLEQSCGSTAGTAGRIVLALSGLAGSLLYVIGAFLPGSTPKPDASMSQVVGFFLRERNSLLAGSTIELASLLFILMFLGELRTVIGRSDDSVATAMTAAWVVLVTIVAVAMLPAIAILWGGVGTADPRIVRWAFDIQNLGLYSVSAPAAAISVAVPSAVIWRKRVLPRGLAILGVIEVAVNILEIIGLPAKHGALAGGYVDGIGPVVWVLWVAATSICMAIRASRP